MISAYNKTGFEWDDKRESEYRSLTQRIDRALLKMEKELVKYKTKPTIDQLSQLSKCSKGALRDRARKDARARQLREIDDDGIILRDDKGNPIFAKYGSPISDLQRLQKAWRLLKKYKSGNIIPEGKGNNRQPPKNVPKGLLEIDELGKRLKRYMMENSVLKYDLEREKEKNKVLEKSADRTHEFRERLEQENAELKEAFGKLKKDMNKGRLNIVH